MTVFKCFLKVLNKYKGTVILFTTFLIAFGAFNMQTSESSTNFVATRPEVFIVCQDEAVGVTKNLVKFLENNMEVNSISQDEEAMNDALFYRDVNYIIYIPQNYREDFLNGKNPKIEIKSTGDYQSSYAEMLLNRYLKTASIYLEDGQTEEQLMEKINDTLTSQTQIEIMSKLDTTQLSKAAVYYNFANYSILAGCVYVICLILSSFKEQKIRQRTIISSMKNKTYNRSLLLSNSLFAIALWLIYVLLSFVLIGKVMFSLHGVWYILNSFVFTLCALSIAFFIGNLLTNKNAINGIVNVVALGSSFLCGAFVPAQWLPDTVLKVAHILPSYWYIQSNELIKTLEVINLETLKPIFINMGVVCLFIILFVLLTNIITKKKRKIG